MTERERRAERGGATPSNNDVDNDQQQQQQQALRALILTPTRELAVQVANHVEAAAYYCDIRIAPVIGGMSLQKQVRFALRSSFVLRF